MIFDNINNIDNYKGLEKIYTVLEFLKNTDFSNAAVGKYSIDGDDIYYMVQEYDSQIDKKVVEAHRKYIDIQYMLNGIEDIGVAPLTDKAIPTQEMPDSDAWLYELKTTPITISNGDFAVLYPNDLHMPGCATNNVSSPCRKIVVKIKI